MIVLMARYRDGRARNCQYAIKYLKKLTISRAAGFGGSSGGHPLPGSSSSSRGHSATSNASSIYGHINRVMGWLVVGWMVSWF